MPHPAAPGRRRRRFSTSYGPRGIRSQGTDAAYRRTGDRVLLGATCTKLAQRVAHHLADLPCEVSCEHVLDRRGASVDFDAEQVAHDDWNHPTIAYEEHEFVPIESSSIEHRAHVDRRWGDACTPFATHEERVLAAGANRAARWPIWQAPAEDDAEGSATA